ncbi:VOC family protein [Lysinibacter sp. HNR]|uniref:VOC family protein n=1 Tax=Lysinibacter sp. HNR TaxID=3031408 RepID=UPI0024349EE2|nr:VOC family protein [Lysinibacter sp. HNR]WGD37377.1 VOC family protein [Lysinibacter sp. HNR]
MSTFIQNTTGEPVWIDFFSSDPAAASEFYTKLFGWTSREDGNELGGYTNFFLGGKHIAGLMPNNTNGAAPDAWTVYLHTNNAEATANAITKAGGSVQLTYPVHDLGTMVMATDPSGAVVAGWQAGTHFSFDEVRVPGTPAWFELRTEDYHAAVSFYREAFGWDTSVISDTDSSRYCTLGAQENAKAGILEDGGLSEDDPSQWIVYFGVASVEASVDLAIDLGGTLIHKENYRPFGRVATLRDPFGAPFKIVQTRYPFGF